MSDTHAVQDAPSSGGAESDNSEPMTSGEVCGAVLSCIQAVEDLPMCPEPPDGLYPVPRTFAPSNDVIEHDSTPDMAVDILLGLGIGKFVFKESATMMAKNIFFAYQMQAKPQEFTEWMTTAPTDIPTGEYHVPERSTDDDEPDASLPDKPDATVNNPGQTGPAEIGVADPGETGSTSGKYVPPLGNGPDPGVDPSENTGGGGRYVAPVRPGPDSGVDPGENTGGGGYVAPVGPGPDPAEPGGDGGGGGGGGGIPGGADHSGGPVKEE